MLLPFQMAISIGFFGTEPNGQNRQMMEQRGHAINLTDLDLDELEVGKRAEIQ